MFAIVVVSIVIGILFLLYTIFSQKNHKLRVVLGILGISLVLFGSFGYGALKPLPMLETYDIANKRTVEYPVKSVQIISPVQDDVVKCRILTMGVYPEGHDKNIWLLIKASDNKYYPQSDWTNTSYKEDGKWQVVNRFGGSPNEKYELIAYETDDEVSHFFSETVENWKSNGVYIGLEASEIPDAAVEVDRVEVILEKNCLGRF